MLENSHDYMETFYQQQNTADNFENREYLKTLSKIDQYKNFLSKKTNNPSIVKKDEELQLFDYKIIEEEDQSRLYYDFSGLEVKLLDNKFSISDFSIDLISSEDEKLELADDEQQIDKENALDILKFNLTISYKVQIYSNNNSLIYETDLVTYEYSEKIFIDSLIGNNLFFIKFFDQNTNFKKLIKELISNQKINSDENEIDLKNNVASFLIDNLVKLFEINNMNLKDDIKVEYMTLPLELLDYKPKIGNKLEGFKLSFQIDDDLIIKEKNNFDVYIPFSL